LAYSGLSPELYFIFGTAFRAALVCAAKAAAFLVALVVAANAAAAARCSRSFCSAASFYVLSPHAVRSDTINNNRTYNALFRNFKVGSPSI
jgi:hypothetical protein